MGRIYVTSQSAGALLRFDADGSNRTTLLMGLSSPANIEFGVGPLNCNDVYVATGRGVVRHEGDTPGAMVPWH